jgi:hypothetical protein
MPNSVTVLLSSREYERRLSVLVERLARARTTRQILSIFGIYKFMFITSWCSR